MTLNWRTIAGANHPRFLVKGTELASAVIPDCLSRFVVYEIRTYDAENNADRCYVIRDAHTVSDDQLREGVRPAIIARLNNLDELDDYLLTNSGKPLG